MGPPDPDVFYSSEGLAVTSALYEGLLQYNPNNTNTVLPLLATSWTVSTNQLTYTFHLRAGVMFHDGTAFTSAAAVMSFKRRVAVAGGPAYMLDAVGSMATPDPLTFVVHLKHPVSAFLSYLASPYGPRMLSPAVLQAHYGSNEAQSWLQTHDAGTGPYVIGSWKPNQEYVLQRFPRYWGPAPAVPTINIPIVPDISTQQLELDSRQVDMIVHGLTPQQIAPYEHDSKFTVSSFASLQATMLVINPDRGVFANSQLRAALVDGVDRASLTSEVFGDLATPAKEIYPRSMLSGTGGVEPAFQPNALADAVRASGSTGKKVEIGYDISDPFNGRVAEVLGADLQKAGLSYTSVGIPDAQTYAIPSHPQSAPDILIVTTNPDAGHPDTWVRIYMNTNGSTNYLSCSVPAADKEMDAGLAATGLQTVEQDYETVGNLLVKSNCWEVIANVNDTVVARSGVTDITHQLPANATVIFANLRATA
jgi:peptide/nickel transport system substrate-binding protein